VSDADYGSSENLAHVIAMEAFRTERIGQNARIVRPRKPCDHDYEQLYVCKHCGVAEERH
jgi:hypothetical protein